jgi:hypothetical protein
MQARQCSLPPTMAGTHPILAWFGLLFIILPTLTTTTSYPIHASLQSFIGTRSMAIQTRTSGVKTRAAKADASAVIRPRRNPRSTSRSPRGENINIHLAKLNLSGSRFDGGSTVLRKEGQEDLDSLCILRVPTLEKPRSMPPLTPPSASRRVSWCLFSTRARSPLNNKPSLLSESTITPLLHHCVRAPPPRTTTPHPAPT